MFEEVAVETFEERENRILEFWKNEEIFRRSLQQREKAPRYSFYDGPPFATGLPHYGHLLAGTIKDVVPRYQTMKGKFVDRRFGWDTHGLPIEHEIEKAHNLNGAGAIETFGIEKFNCECRKIVLRFTEEWKEVVTRMGRWVDFDRTWKTMDHSFMESVWWVFKQLWEKELVYQGFKVMPFSAKLGTPLSNFEAGENYKEVDDPSLTAMLALDDDPNTYLLIWTTTPWTLISNLAVLAGPDIEYIKVRDVETEKQYILARARLLSLFHDESRYEVLEKYTGTELDGTTYKPFFSYFADLKQQGAFRIILDDHVDLAEGTGLVHSAPAFGELDFYACERAGIPLVCPVDTNGCFTEEVPQYAGKFVKDADKAIVKELKDLGMVFDYGTCRHRYPFCWRSDTPLIYRAVSTWFVRVEAIKDQLLKNNEKIHWTPDHLKHGRFGKWLEGARDWAISRNRYWGTPIPIWMSDEGKTVVFGSILELEEATGTKVRDLHRHCIDDLTFEKEGKTYRRIPEVFDCWFESGSMPYAQHHYPFENNKLFHSTFPADFIAEGLDQTRGWFYTLNILSTALFNQPAFQNVVVNGIVLAEDGNKMSKRLQNYPDPMEVIHKYGADAVRLYMMHSPAVRGADLRFSEKGVELVLRQILIPLFNAHSFLVTYARIYEWAPKTLIKQPLIAVDRWVLSMTHKLIFEVQKAMDDYDLSRAVEPFVGFIDQLTNWYIRRSRRRFWQEEDNEDRRSAFVTLYEVLINLCKVTAPFIPFISEAIYQNLRSDEMPQSVHLCNYPEYGENFRDSDLEETMQCVQIAVSLGHALRKEHKLKVRQPLPCAYLASPNSKTLAFLDKQRHLIKEELNVKEIVLEEDESKLVTLQAKANFRSLGQRVGKLMPQVKDAIENFSQHQLITLLDGGGVSIEVEGEEVVLSPDDVEVVRVAREGLIASTEGEIAIALDTTLNEELILEGLAREAINKINTMRRACGFEVSDRISVRMETTDKVLTCFEIYGDFIKSEVLATDVEFGPCEGQQWDLNGETARIILDKL